MADCIALLTYTIVIVIVVEIIFWKVGDSPLAGSGGYADNRSSDFLDYYDHDDQINTSHLAKLTLKTVKIMHQK